QEPGLSEEVAARTGTRPSECAACGICRRRSRGRGQQWEAGDGGRGAAPLLQRVGSSLRQKCKKAPPGWFRVVVCHEYVREETNPRLRSALDGARHNQSPPPGRVPRLTDQA